MLISRFKEFYYHRYDATPLHLKTKLRPVINCLYCFRYIRSRINAARIKRGFPNPSYSIPRDLGFSPIELKPKILIHEVVKHANKILKEYKVSDMGKSVGKNYLRTIANISDFDPHDSIVQIAINDELLSCVAKYLGAAPHLNGINVMWSPPLKLTEKKEGDWTGSQLFHIDGDSDGIVKVWILCNSVSEENGPTVLIPADESLRISKELKYTPNTKVKDDKPFKNVITKSFKGTGDIGTVFATDTARCFHQGSRTKVDSERLVVMYFFDTFRSAWYLADYQRPTIKMTHEWKTFISNLPSHKRNLFRTLK